MTTEGAGLLDDLRAAFCRYVAFPSPQAADAAVLWTAATHGIAAWQHAPRLVARSVAKRCGKSRFMDVVNETCHRPLMTVNASPAAVFRSIGDKPPTLLVDEADTLFGTKKAAENHEDLRGLLNAGFQRGRTTLRCQGPLQTPTEFQTFAMAMLACIGSLPDTIEDRAVVILMRRRAPGEHVEPYRTRRDQPALKVLKERLATWIGANLAVLTAAEPDMPLEDRAADTWEPLVAVADLAGGPWPARARAAALRFVADADDGDADRSLTVRLLADVRDVFKDYTVSFLASQELVNALCKLEDAPWRNDSPWREDFLSPARLAALLRDYGVRPRRNPAGSLRGYALQDFHDPFVRYLRQKPSDRQGDAPDVGKRSDTLSVSDALTRQTVRTDSPPACASDDLTPSDGGGAPDGPCIACRKPTPRYGPGGAPLCPACQAARAEAAS